ncbi:MAG: hypothetical protein K8T89_20345 [Planctomycetes bacterium]|nr:hypothetical protein [Planctomycetota bacterium]
MGWPRLLVLLPRLLVILPRLLVVLPRLLVIAPQLLLLRVIVLWRLVVVLRLRRMLRRQFLPLLVGQCRQCDHVQFTLDHG